jgi:hypothetical protein
MTVPEAFAAAGFTVPDLYSLVWNSRAGWMLRDGPWPDAIFSTRPSGQQRVIAPGWVVPQYSIPRHFDEGGSGVDAAVNVYDSLPDEVKPVVTRWPLND